MFRLLLSAALLVTGSAAVSADGPRPTADARLAAALDGLVAGAPQNCIDPRQVTATARFGRRIVYSYSRGERYVTDTGGGCFRLDRGDAIVTSTPSGRFCRGDIVRTVEQTSRFPSGSCSFGDFVPYTRPRGQ